MKTSHPKTFRGGFSLIELLVVIAIIAILAGLMIPAMGTIKQKMAIRRAQAELGTFQTAIESYKAKMGHYPPDNPINLARNQLYYELVGCTVSGNGTSFTPLDGAPMVTLAQLTAAGIAANGIVNSGAATASDDGGSAQQFLRELKPANYGEVAAGVRLLGVKVDGPGAFMVGDLNPIRYNSSKPTNNVNSFDLWVDLVLGGKTNRISNWSPTPIRNP